MSPTGSFADDGLKIVRLIDSILPSVTPNDSAAIAPLKPYVSTIPNITKTKAGVVNIAFFMT